MPFRYANKHKAINKKRDFTQLPHVLMHATKSPHDLFDFSFNQLSNIHSFNSMISYVFALIMLNDASKTWADAAGHEKADMCKVFWIKHIERSKSSSNACNLYNQEQWTWNWKCEKTVCFTYDSLRNDWVRENLQQLIAVGVISINILSAGLRRLKATMRLSREKAAEDFDSPIIRKGAARLIPMNSTPIYMASPKAAAVDMQALMLPSSPSHGFDRTVSHIMHVKILPVAATN